MSETVTTKQDFTKTKNWYVDHADKVFEVHCGGCGSVVAIEVKFDKSGTYGKYRDLLHPRKHMIAPTSKLMGYRYRLDNTVGYQCSCGQDTRLLDEESILHHEPLLLPHVEADIMGKIKERSPDFKHDNDFELRRVK